MTIRFPVYWRTSHDRLIAQESVVKQHAGPETGPQRRAVLIFHRIAGTYRQHAAKGVRVLRERERDLLVIVDAVALFGRLSCLAERGHQHRGEDRDDRDHDEQLDQCEQAPDPDRGDDFVFRHSLSFLLML